MTKTTIRGFFPGHPVPKHLLMKPIKEIYAPPDKNRGIRGKSQYKEFIDHLMSGEPGTLAIECTDMRAAKQLGQAVSRYLRQQGLYDTLRARFRKDGDTCFKVWVVKQE